MRKFISQRSGDEYSTFLDAIDAEPFSIKDIDHQALLEFLIFGSFYFENTLFNGLKKKFTHQTYTLDIADGLVEESLDKENPLTLGDFYDPVDAFLVFFEQRLHHLQNKKISVDLTGGIDSRLIATIFKHFGVSFDATFSLNSGDAHEAEIVKEVADCLQVDLNILKSDGIKSEKEWTDLFKLSDGLWDFTKLKSLKSNQSWREKEGYDVVITGVGGELYKDFWWQQDFPLYSKRTTDLDKLISMRMYPARIDENWFTGGLYEAYKSYPVSFKDKLQLYVDNTNTESYDQIYYHVRIKEQVSLLSNITAHFLDTYSPLLEPELLKIGYNLPRRKRFFNQFHREVITKINPALAKIETTEGNISVSNKLLDKVSDLKNYGSHKFKNLLNKLGEKEPKPISVEPWLQEEYQESLKILQPIGFISDKIPDNYHLIGKNLVGRLVTVSEVIKRLK